MLLGVNIDHVATLRQQRLCTYPSPIDAALIAEAAGADSITMHLREDRRHIVDADVYCFQHLLKTHVNLECAITPEMIAIACDVKPRDVCLVPERREELTTEGGLDVKGHLEQVKAAVAQLQEAGIRVSLFIDPEEAQLEAAVACGAPVVELHTGAYAEAAEALMPNTACHSLHNEVAQWMATHPEMNPHAKGQWIQAASQPVHTCLDGTDEAQSQSLESRVNAPLVPLQAASGAPLVWARGHEVNACTPEQKAEYEAELTRLQKAARAGVQLSLQVNAGHGLHYGNVAPIVAMSEITELNIGHAIVARAVFVGLHQAVAEMKALMQAQAPVYTY